MTGNICGLSFIAIPPFLRSTQVRNSRIGEPEHDEDQSDLHSETYSESHGSSHGKSKSSKSSRSGKTRNKHRSRSDHSSSYTPAAAPPVATSSAAAASAATRAASAPLIINLARQWKTMYDHGKVQNPPVAAVVAGSFYYLTWQVRSKHALYERLVGSSDAMLYCGAAFLTLGIVPWTLTAMLKTNAALEGISGGDLTLTTKDESGEEDVVVTVGDDEFDGLVRRWQVLNGIRGLFPLVGGILGLYAVLS